jgi:hypothetical protein
MLAECMSRRCKVKTYRYYYYLSTTFPMLNIPCLQMRESSSHWLMRHLPTITVPKCKRPSKIQVPSVLPTVFYVERIEGYSKMADGFVVKVMMTYELPFEHK